MAARGRRPAGDSSVYRTSGVPRPVGDVKLARQVTRTTLDDYGHTLCLHLEPCDVAGGAERQVGRVTSRRSRRYVSVGSRRGGETFDQAGELVGVVCGDDDTEAVAPAQHGVFFGGE